MRASVLQSSPANRCARTHSGELAAILARSHVYGLDIETVAHGEPDKDRTSALRSYRARGFPAATAMWAEEGLGQLSTFVARFGVRV